MFKKIFIVLCFLIPSLTFAQPICNSEEQCLPLAKQNNAEAQGELGEFYYINKKGIMDNHNQDYQEAIIWFEKAAKAGDEKAQYYLGLMNYQGQGVGVDYEKAVEWFTKSAAAGNVKAQFYLGVCYYYGKGVTKDLRIAKEWFIKADDGGSDEAKVYLELLKNKYVFKNLTVYDCMC